MLACRGSRDTLALPSFAWTVVRLTAHRATTDAAAEAALLVEANEATREVDTTERAGEGHVLGSGPLWSAASAEDQEQHKHDDAHNEHDEPSGKDVRLDSGNLLVQRTAPSRMRESGLDCSRMPEKRTLRGLGAILTPYAGELPYLTSQGLVEPAGSFGGFGAGAPTSQGQLDGEATTYLPCSESCDVWG